VTKEATPAPRPAAAARKRRTAPRLARVPPGSRQRAELAAERLAWVHDQRSDLAFRNMYELAIATILAAQTTDVTVNTLTRVLFERYPDASSLGTAGLPDLEEILRPVGYFRAKARTIQAAGQTISDRFEGSVPTTIDELVTIPGIGRKTASVVLAAGMGQPAIVTDRHVMRVAERLRLTSEQDPDKIERQLARLLPPERWTGFSMRMTLHGRYVCLARRAACERCVLNDFCPSSSTRTWAPEERLRLSLSLRGTRSSPDGPRTLESAVPAEED
jgi:endonuclease III